MEGMKRVQIPAFGYWDYCDDREMPITQYFENAVQAGLIKGHFFVDNQDDVADDDDDLFKVPVAPLCNSHHRNHGKVKKGGGGEKHHHHPHQQQQQQLVKKQQGKVHDLTRQRSPRKPNKAPPKAVDEDLYKIPPELLLRDQKPKRNKLLRSLWSGCLGLNCIA